ncbi:MAG: S1/P1 Nuclease [Cyclobacteriaceae bacterium]|nr:S1/P1 Nuclease [Cyclobacteriaceae bacterium]
MKSTLKILLLSAVLAGSGWGFFGHRKINQLAVFTLPPEMIGFYKKNMNHLIEASTYPDSRRYAVPEEAPRHFMDVEEYGDSAFYVLPKYWNQAVKKYGEDTLNMHGIVPWHIVRMFHQLKDAFMLNDPHRIVRSSAELAHYISDCNVPLHSTRNHNGQLTGQHGIHGLWESRLPELFFEQYDFYVGKAEYVNDPQERAWQAIRNSHDRVDSVLSEERLLSENSSVKFNYETKGKQTIKVYSVDFSKKYHDRLRGMVERQFRASVKMTGDFWYTAWVDAGQPDLKRLIHYRPTEEELKQNKEELRKWKEGNYASREHEIDSIR